MTTQQPTKFDILLLGDACNDVYTYGHVTRISPEAPVPVFETSYIVSREGMAGNVADNLETLGCNVNFLHGQYSVKNRLIDIRSKQQLLRMDKDVESDPIKFHTDIPDIYDAIVISDYNKGTISYELVEQLRAEFNGPIFVDTKKTDLAKMKGCYVKINALEESRLTTFPDDRDLIVTHGDKGATWAGHKFQPENVGDVIDVCGAGDTFLSALVYRFLETNSMFEAIKFANRAAAVTVQHVGVYAPTLEEIK